MEASGGVTAPKEKISDLTALGMSSERKAGPRSVPASYAATPRDISLTHSPSWHRGHESTPVNLHAPSHVDTWSELFPTVRTAVGTGGHA